MTGKVFQMFWDVIIVLQTFLFFQNEPYITIKSDGKYEGFCIDLLDEISKLAGFNYNLHLVPDGKYGVHLGNGVYDGMIGEIQRRVSKY